MPATPIQTTPDQDARLERLAHQFGVLSVTSHHAFDLPPGWVYVVVTYDDRGTFHCGIAPDGSCAS